MRNIIVSFLIAAGIFSTGAAAGCEDIAVVSEDAKYIVLSGDDFTEKDVGDLRWLSIRSVLGPAPGSSFTNAVLHVRFFDPETGQILMPTRGSTGIVIHELGRNLQTASELTIAGVDKLYNAWWLDNDQLVDKETNGTTTRITIKDIDLNQIGEWETQDLSIGGLRVGCIDNSGRTIIAGLTTRMIIDKNAMKLDPLERADRDNGYRMGGLTLGCLAILVHVDEARPNRLKMARIDMVANQIESEFETRRNGRWLMFSDGQRLLEHEMDVEEVEGGVRYHPTRRIRILNTDNGQIIREGVLPEGGVLEPTINQMPQLFCRGEAERVVLSAGNIIYLIDLETLSVIASRRVPFDQYFVM